MANPDINIPQSAIVDPATGRLSREWLLWLINPHVLTLIIGTALGVESGGTGLTEGTSGGVLGFTDTDVIESSVELTADQIVLGGGAGATPIPLGSLGTTTTLLHGNAAGPPTFGSVATNDIANDAVTFAKFQNITDDRLLGRSAGTSGDMQEILVGDNLLLSGGTLSAIVADTGYWSPVGNGDLTDPQIVFDADGAPVVVFISL